MTVARTVLPTDLVALVAFDGRVYPNEAKTRERLGRDESGPRPLESALEQWFSFATGRHTWISVRGATLRGLMSARRRGGAQAWEVDTLVNAAEDDDDVCLSLFDRAAADAGRAGAQKIFLRVDPSSPILTLARRAGFEAVTTETLYARRGPLPTEKAPALPLRRRTRADAYPLFRLYSAAVPIDVRRLEAATFVEWRAAQERRWLGRRSVQLVFEEDGAPAARLRLARDGDTGLFDVLSRRDCGARERDLVLAALARLSRQETLLSLVPRYQDGVARCLEELGFQRGPEYVLLVRRTVVPLKAPELAALKPPVVAS